METGYLRNKQILAIVTYKLMSNNISFKFENYKLDVTGYFKLSLESPATYSKLKLRSDSNAGPINCVSFMNGQCTGTVVPMQNIYLAVFPVDNLI